MLSCQGPCLGVSADPWGHHGRATGSLCFYGTHTRGYPLAGAGKQPGRGAGLEGGQSSTTRLRSSRRAILGTSFSHLCSVDQFSFGSSPVDTAALLLTGWRCSPSLPKVIISSPNHPCHRAPRVGSSEHPQLTSRSPGDTSAFSPELLKGKGGHLNKRLSET